MKRATLATHQVDAQEQGGARLLFLRIWTLPNYQYNINRKGTGSTLSLFADKSSRRQY
jgi:hypothetical protein